MKFEYNEHTLDAIRDAAFKGYNSNKMVCCGENFTVGLITDGRVVACGDNTYGQCNVVAWEDVVSIACGSSHTVGVKYDGTVVYAGSNKYGQCRRRHVRLL